MGQQQPCHYDTARRGHRHHTGIRSAPDIRLPVCRRPCPLSRPPCKLHFPGWTFRPSPACRRQEEFRLHETLQMRHRPRCRIRNPAPPLIGSSEKVCVFNFVVSDGLMPRAQRRSTDRSSSPDWFSTLAATGHSGDMHRDDAIEAYIEGRPRISPILPRPLSGRTLSSHILANGEGREQISFKIMPSLISYTGFCR